LASPTAYRLAYGQSSTSKGALRIFIFTNRRDAHALVPAIADTQVRGLGPEELLADTLYGSDENHRVAAAA
jgi:hypothetical protein